MTIEQKVEAIAKANELTTKKDIADHIGVNASSLGTAMKKDSSSGKIFEAVTRAFDALEKPTKKKAKGDRKAPAGRLNNLHKVGDTHWAAELSGSAVDIVKTDDGWAARMGKKNLAEEKNFKSIITALREQARAAA